MTNNVLVLAIKSWNISNFKKHKKENWYLISEKEELTLETVEKINPKYILVPHWSWIIPKKIWGKYETVVFHMTDLPYWRGWSPLQNLIVRWHKETKISAIHVNWWIDTWDVYMKQELDLSWTADEILNRASNLIYEKMIPKILEEKLVPKVQKWEIVEFKRRKKEDGEIPENASMEQFYDYIRMLDGEWYPNAFIKHWDKKILFKNAKIENWELKANITITQSESEL